MYPRERIILIFFSMNTILETKNLRKEFFLSYFPKRSLLACDDINVKIKLQAQKRLRSDFSE